MRFLKIGRKIVIFYFMSIINFVPGGRKVIFYAKKMLENSEQTCLSRFYGLFLKGI